MPKLIVDPERCTGCNSCILACSFAHEGYFSLSEARIQIDKNEGNAQFDPRVCIQCDDIYCVKICPTDALSRDENLGIIKWNGQRCIHCHLCEKVCPYGGIHFNSDDKLLVCDLCGGDPECIKVCKFPEAIKYEV